MKQINRMLNHENDPEADKTPSLHNVKASEEASKVAEDLMMTLAETLDGRKMSPLDLMQGLVEFFVPAVRAIEQMDKVPPNFRRFLMRNVELNFDYRDAKDQGIDLSELLIMGLRDELDGDLGDAMELNED